MSSTDIVIQTEHLSTEAAQWLAQRCTFIVCSHDDPKFADLVTEAVGLVVRTYTTVDQRLLDGAPKLKVVGRAGAGGQTQVLRRRFHLCVTLGLRKGGDLP